MYVCTWFSAKDTGLLRDGFSRFASRVIRIGSGSIATLIRIVNHPDNHPDQSQTNQGTDQPTD